MKYLPSTSSLGCLQTLQLIWFGHHNCNKGRAKQGSYDRIIAWNFIRLSHLSRKFLKCSPELAINISRFLWRDCWLGGEFEIADKR